MVGDDVARLGAMPLRARLVRRVPRFTARVAGLLPQAVLVDCPLPLLKGLPGAGPEVRAEAGLLEVELLGRRREDGVDETVDDEWALLRRATAGTPCQSSLAATTVAPA
jgi:hypothetical protein